VQLLKLRARPGELKPIGLAVHVRGGERKRLRHDHESVCEQRLDRLDDIPGAGPDREPRAQLARDIRPEPSCDSLGSSLAERLDGDSQAQECGRVGRSATEPGGHRDPLADRDPHRWPGPTLPTELLKGGRDEVRSLHPRADHFVRPGGSDLELELIA